MSIKKSQNIKISIIVPVYNVYEYLDECVLSLINQTYNNIEIILVDDGSTDGSDKICDMYAAKESNVIVVHKANGGLSDARNCGVDRASGDYIMFVDSDDYIEEKSCQYIYDAIQNSHADVIVGDAIVDGNKKEIQFRSYGSICGSKFETGKDFLKKSIVSNTFYSGVVLYIYNKCFWNRNNFRFQAGILHEDLLITPAIMYKANSVYLMDKIFYHMRYREDSITHDVEKRKKRIRDIEYIMNKWIEFSKSIDDIELRNAFNGLISKCYINSCSLNKLTKPNFELISRYYMVKNALSAKELLKILLFISCPRVYVLLWNVAHNSGLIYP